MPKKPKSKKTTTAPERGKFEWILDDLSMEQILESLDKCFDDQKLIEGYELAEKAAKEQESAMQNAEFLWRYGRACYAHGKNLPDKKAGKQIVLDGYQHVLKSLELDETIGWSHSWKGIYLDIIGEYEGVKKRIENSYEAEKEWRRAVELNPGDAVTHHCLGMWNFEISDLPWIQKKLAAIVYAKLPQTSYEQALEYFQKAEEVKPGFFSLNALMIGKSLIRLKRQSEAIEWLKKARDWSPKKIDDDHKAHELAIKLLKDAGHEDDK